MTEVTTERRKNVNLKRSKSVRASLRMIGNRFLHHNKDKPPRSPSLQNLCYEHHQVETILKTPQPEPKIRPKIPFTTPPPVVAPKAAAVLQIPIEHCGGRHSWFLHKNWRECDLQGRFSELLVEGGGDGGNNNGENHQRFHRGSLRLSIMAKRRQGGWNPAAFSSTSSRCWLGGE